jgi:FkbM family methyltransferase
VRERWRFALRHGLGGAPAATYHLRSGGLIARVRHDGSNDAWVLHEVFRGGDYDPPRPLGELVRREPRRIVDLGTNVGYFSLRMLANYPGTTVVGFEPDVSNAASVREAIRRNRLEERWQLVEAAASTDDGELLFHGGFGSKSRQARPGEEEGAVAVPARDVFPYLDDVDLLKMDIEGGEWGILADPRFAGAAPPAIVLEYHSLMCPQDNPRRAVKELLANAGYAVEPAASDSNPDDGPFWGVGVIWAWRD